ncbi:MAG: lycopene cyclase family protein [Bacteroidia bacterium]
MSAGLVYDYAIIGAGAAGLQLALALSEDAFFREKKIVLLEAGEKINNDRTWSFWEKGAGKFDSVVYRKWERAAFINDGIYLDLSLAPYLYKSIRGIDFYAFAFSKLRQQVNVTVVNAEVTKVVEGKPVTINTSAGMQFHAAMVFDSRLPEQFTKESVNYPGVLQHFKGWMVQTDNEAFNPSQFVMMDFSARMPDTTSFMYVLPHSSTKALVEFTYFSPNLVGEEIYDQAIKKYLNDKLKISSYTISETEYGVIPMSLFPFHQYHSDHVYKIGTAGGWVKPGSGYSFHNAMKNVGVIVANLKTGRKVMDGLYSAKHRWYDKLLIDILQRQNDKGPEIFTQMYRKNTPSSIFAFLDEETGLNDDLKIISSFNPVPFIAALFRTIGK